MSYIGIKVPQNICEILKTIDVGGERCDTSDYHITICILEDDPHEKDLIKIIDSAYSAVKSVEPFEINCEKISSFNSEDKYPIHAALNSEDLMNLHDKIESNLKDSGVDIDDKFKNYKPHITLAYSDERIKDLKIKNISFLVQELVIVIGDADHTKLNITIPLYLKKKSAHILNKLIKNFHKTASKKEQKFKYTIEQVKSMPKSKLLGLIQKGKDFIKKDKIFKEMCSKYNLDTDVVESIPIVFGDLDVSAKTKKGIITLNYRLLQDGDFFEDFSYLIHECQHYLDQCYGEKPTTGGNKDGEDYLSNKFEQEAFQNQIDYISDHFGNDAAEEYAENLLSHHDIDDDEKDEKKQELMAKV